MDRTFGGHQIPSGNSRRLQNFYSMFSSGIRRGTCLICMSDIQIGKLMTPSERHQNPVQELKQSASKRAPKSLHGFQNGLPTPFDSMVSLEHPSRPLAYHFFQPGPPMGKATDTPKALPKSSRTDKKSTLHGNSLSSLIFDLIWLLRNQVSGSKLAWFSKVFDMLISNSVLLQVLKDVPSDFLTFGRLKQLIMVSKVLHFAFFFIFSANLHLKAQIAHQKPFQEPPKTIPRSLPRHLQQSSETINITT